MNSDDDNDIARLFAQFGGDPDTYQEIASVAAAREARSRWPILSAFDPLAGATASAVSADDAVGMAQAMHSVGSTHETDPAVEPGPRAQLIPPRPRTFSREVPRAFLVPAAPAPAAVESPTVPPVPEVADDKAIASTALPTGHRLEPTIDAAPVPELIDEPALVEAALEGTSEPQPEGESLPAASADPFRRLAAGPTAASDTQRLPDLFKRLLSS
jgi:hypothetical protein